MFEKFPEILFEGRRLIWDTRQVPNSLPEWVFVPQDSWINEEIKQKLLQRKNAKFVGDLGSGLDLEVEKPRNLLGEWASLGLGEPSRHLKILGVTGTNGKTTSVALMRTLVLAAGKSVCEIGTLGIQIWDPKNPQDPIEKWTTGFTTPEAPQLHNFFVEILKKKIEVVVMEVSSHASTLGRIAGVDFNGMVLTNLSQDHLDFHGTLRDYAKAKENLFTEFLSMSANQSSLTQPSRKSKFAVVNLDGDIAFPLAASVEKNISSHISLKSLRVKRDYKIANYSDLGVEIELQKSFGSFPVLKTFKLPLLGDYNAENFVGALSLVAQVLPEIRTLSPEDLLKNFHGVAGRMENIQPGARVWVDYAHTPDALEKSLLTLREVCGRGQKIWVVFGCGGDRDRGKRPQMGKIASQLADIVVLTSDNPRSEDPNFIISEIEKGFDKSRNTKIYIETDRRKAIELALKNRAEKDLVLIAGKGHESVQIFKNQSLEFSDQKTALSFLKDLNK